MASGMASLGTLSGSSTAARSAARSPARNAPSIFLNLSYSAHHSRQRADADEQSELVPSSPVRSRGGLGDNVDDPQSELPFDSVH